MQAENMTTITATIDKIRFEKDGFVIFSITNKKTKKTMGAKGSVMGSSKDYVGQDVVFTGEVESSQYGDTISFESVAIEEGVAYFWKQVAKIPRKAQDNIIARFGADASWLDNDKNIVIQRLSTVPGVKLKTIEKVLSRWAEYQEIKKLMEVVSLFNISQNQAAKIYRHFESDAINVILNHPYRLSEVSGFGFKKTDEIALKIGVDEKDIKRYASAFSYAMNEVNRSGSTLVSDVDFMNVLNDILVMSDGSVAFGCVEELKALIVQSQSFLDNPVVYVDDGLVTLKSSYQMDKYILSRLLESRNGSFLSVDAEKAASIVFEREDCKGLGEEQKDAIVKVLSSGAICVVRGGAGTGKTTTSKTLLNIMADVFSLEREEIVGCALAGVAASRIKNQSGFNSYTIHSLLGTSEGGGWLHNSDNPLPHKIVVLDESGMIETSLFFSLLKAIDFSQTKLIMLGDTAQLLAVGAGQPFIDMINMELVPVATLSKIYRQSEDKAIAVVAEQVKEGKRPPIHKEYSDVASYKIQGATTEQVNLAIEESLLVIARKYKDMKAPDLNSKSSVLDYLYGFQVITPRKNGVLGREALNKALRVILLPSMELEKVCESHSPITVYEKVIHLKNMRMRTIDGDDVKIYNGMIGIVTSINTEEDEFTVHYPLEGHSVVYNEKMVAKGEVGYAWALTIHKTQGSEYKNVAIPFSTSHWMMLNNKLTYTAITRAKESCHLVGSVKAFNHACTQVDSTIRNTVLQVLASCAVQ